MDGAAILTEELVNAMLNSIKQNWINKKRSRSRNWPNSEKKKKSVAIEEQRSIVMFFRGQLWNGIIGTRKANIKYFMLNPCKSYYLGWLQGRKNVATLFGNVCHNLQMWYFYIELWLDNCEFEHILPQLQLKKDSLNVWCCNHHADLSVMWSVVIGTITTLLKLWRNI